MAFGFPPLPTPALNPDKRTFGASWVRFLREMYKLRPTQGSVIDGGQLIEDQVLTPFVDNTITHTLGRTPKLVIPAKSQSIECDAYGYRNAALSVDASTWTSYVDAESYDLGGNVSSGVFTAPVAGLYDFRARAELQSVDAARVRIRLLVGGSDEYAGNQVQSGTAAAVMAATGAWLLHLVQGDTVAAQVFHDDGAARNMTTGATESWFAARLVRETWESSRNGTGIVLQTTYAHTVSLWVM